MPPKNVKALMAKLRKQGRQSRPVAKPGSAFTALDKNNKANRRGANRTYTDLGGEEQQIPEAQKPKKARKAAPKRVTKPKQPAPKEPTPEPVIEVWRPAGGEGSESGQSSSLTDTLGLARISTWRLPEFLNAAEALIEQHGGYEGLKTSELVHGAESWTDVYFRFRSELVAELMMEKIEGKMVDGRKLQVTFA